MNPSYLTSDPLSSVPLHLVINTELGEPLPELVQLIYLSIQHVHELLQLALHVALLLLTVFYVQLKTVNSPLQLLVPPLSGLWRTSGEQNKKRYITAAGGHTEDPVLLRDARCYVGAAKPKLPSKVRLK